MLLFGVIGEGGSLREGHVTVLAHEGPLPCMETLVVFQGGVCGKLGTALLAGKRLLVEMLSPLMVLKTYKAQNTITL